MRCRTIFQAGSLRKTLMISSQFLPRSSHSGCRCRALMRLNEIKMTSTINISRMFLQIFPNQSEFNCAQNILQLFHLVFDFLWAEINICSSKVFIFFSEVISDCQSVWSSLVIFPARQQSSCHFLVNLESTNTHQHSSNQLNNNH